MSYESKVIIRLTGDADDVINDFHTCVVKSSSPQ